MGFTTRTALFSLLLGWGLACSEVSAQTRLTDALMDPWRWTHFGVGSGLPSNHVIDVVETGEGVIWAATSSGIAWFDDFEWQPVPGEMGAPTEGIHALVPRAEGGVYVIAEGQLFAGDERGFARVRGVELDPRDVLNEVVVGRDGDLWMAGTAGVFRRRGGRLRRVRPPQEIQESIAGGREAMWLMGREGVREWVDGEWSEPWSWGLPDHVVVATTRRQILVATYEPRSEGVWEAEAGGRSTFHPLQGAGIPLTADLSPDGSAVIAFPDRVAIREGGVWQITERVPPHLVNPRVLRFARNGDLWVGSHRGLSVNRVSSRRWSRWDTEQLPGPFRLVNSLLPVGDSVWVGTAGGLAVRSPDGRMRRWTEIDGTPLGPITALMNDRDGGVWVGSGSRFTGAFRWKDGVWTRFGPDSPFGSAFIHRIHRSAGGSLWFLGLASDRGVRAPVWVLAGGKIETWGPAADLPSQRVYALSEDGEGGAWLATGVGLSRWSAGGWTHWGAKEGLRKGPVFTVATDGAGGVWFGHGAAASGLGHFDGETLSYEADGALGDHIWDLRSDGEGVVWAGSWRGIARIDQAGISVLGQSQGLGMDAVWPVWPTEDRVYVGTIGDGVHELSLAESQVSAPRIRLEAVTGAEGVTLEWAAHAFGAGITPTEILTRFRFDDGEWSEWGLTRQIGPVSLISGNHTFQVQARNVLGEPGVPVTTEFRVPFPPLRQPVVLALVALWGVTLFLWGFSVWRGRSRQLAELKVREERYRQLFHGAPVGIARTEFRTNRVVESNERMAEIFGYRDGAHLVAEFDATKHYVDPDRWREAVRQLVETGIVESLEAEVMRLDGSRAWIRASAYVDEDAGYRESAIMEITREKEAEAEREKLADQLHQAQKMEAVGQLTGGIAHDFNNILTVISGSLGLLLDSADSPRRVERLASQAAFAAERGGELTQRLLAFSRKQVLTPRTLDLNELILGLMGLLRRSLGRGVEILFLPASDLWRCTADPAQFESAVLNLAINARDALPAGGVVSLRVSNRTVKDDDPWTHGGCPPGEYVGVSVQDSGVGMAPDVVRQAVNPFFTTKGVGKGSGLGLSMVFGFVTQSGGYLDIQSHPGVGTTVTMLLPRSHASSVVVPGDFDQEEEPLGRGQRVLLVEDDPAVRALTALMLRELQYEVVEARTAAEGLHITCSGARLDLLLTDVVLPGGIDGEELGRQALRCCPGLRVLYMSGEAGDTRTELEVGGVAVELLTKPFTKRRLAQCVHRAVAGVPSPPGAAEDGAA